jgi:hypothetical protein
MMSIKGMILGDQSEMFIIKESFKEGFRVKRRDFISEFIKFVGFTIF